MARLYRSLFTRIAEADVDWAEMGRRRYWTRYTVSGWMEVVLFLTAAFSVMGLAAHGIRTESYASIYAAVLIALLGFWPHLRHRIRHGRWPN